MSLRHPPYKPNLADEISKLKDRQTYKIFAIIWNKCTKILVMSPKRFRKIPYPEREISQYLCNFSKEVSSYMLEL